MAAYVKTKAKITKKMIRKDGKAKYQLSSGQKTITSYYPDNKINGYTGITTNQYYRKIMPKGGG